MVASVVGSNPASSPIAGNRLGLNEVLWKMSSAANAGATMSSSTTGATSPRCVNRSPVNSVLVVSSIHSPLSHPWGTCGVGMNRGGGVGAEGWAGRGVVGPRVGGRRRLGGGAAGSFLRKRKNGGGGGAVDDL